MTQWVCRFCGGEVGRIDDVWVVRSDDHMVDEWVCPDAPDKEHQP